jgi:phosphatidylserine decarboxylase
LKSSRKKAGVSGEIQLSFTLVDSANENAPEEEIYGKWIIWQSLFTQTGSPASTDEDPLAREFAGGEIVSDEDDEDESPSPGEDAASMTDKVPKKQKAKRKPKKLSSNRSYQFNSGSDVVGVIFLEVSSITDLPPERNGMHYPSAPVTGSD